jgi:hypothetical protein
MPVLVEPHSLPKGSARLYWCSMAAKLFSGGAYIWMDEISGDRPSIFTP